MSNAVDVYWTGLECLAARRIAFRHLRLRMSHTLPNSQLCQRLGLPADHLRPQRLIHWARQQADRGQA
jgi:hypothetical protein